MKQKPQTITITLTDEPEGKIGLQLDCAHEPSDDKTPAEQAAEVMLAALSQFIQGMLNELFDQQ